MAKEAAATLSLRDRLVKNSTIKETAILQESILFTKRDCVPTRVPGINIALGGRIDGGLTPGVLMVAGPSKHFKSAFSLLMVGAYMEAHPDAVLLFYDSEFGTPESYFASFNIPTDRAVHTPIVDIEELKHDISVQLLNISRGDRVIIVIDSVGNLASRKEVEDAQKGDVKADMTRAKQLKSLFRIITPHMVLKDIPLICVGHTYKTMETYAKDVVSGGCLVAGTKIMMFDGTFEEVQDIVVGSMVQTLYGPKLVTKTWNPETLIDGEPECYEIEFEDGSVVTCSDMHRFLINDDWVSAVDLLPGQLVQTLK